MIEKIFAKKWIFIIMALLLMLFLKEDRMILNVPLTLNVSVFLLSFGIVLIFLYRYNSAEKGKAKNKSNTIIDMLGILILAFFIFILLKLAINYYTVKSAEEIATEETKVPIDNFVSGRTDLLYFYFKDKRYSVRYNNTSHLSKKEIIDNYTLHIVYSKSIFDTYVIKKYSIEVK
ncbi:hypothetical protein [Flavobacterium circumlabens]|uniref:Uncharacterized protein n=2 Tax=Flavobacterium circumlabens TaxID=2133765 RepID=A0ABY2ARN1_9FLAO|nr:hypothetical protein [Flavobacterium circumlabens]TCN50335.1 hypothetical protein EV142_1168 [Flavobacterium circumlabens]